MLGKYLKYYFIIYYYIFIIFFSLGNEMDVGEGFYKAMKYV